MLFDNIVKRVIDLKLADFAEQNRRHDDNDLQPTKAAGELRVFLESQPREIIYKLVACMWTGRGDFEEIQESYRTIREFQPVIENHIETLLSSTLVPRYLEKGLAIAAQQFEDLDDCFAWKPRDRTGSPAKETALTYPASLAQED